MVDFVLWSIETWHRMNSGSVMGKGHSEGSIPFIETVEERAKAKRRCRDILNICENMKIPDINVDYDFKLLGHQDVIPLPSLLAYVPEDTRIERSELFFRMIADVRIVYAEVIGQKDEYHQVNILCTDYEIKIDDFRLKAVLRKNELSHPKNGTLVRAYIETGVIELRLLILTLDKRKLPSAHEPQQLGVIRYENLPKSYRLMKELNRENLPVYLKKLGTLKPQEIDKLMESLSLNPKWTYWADLQQQKIVAPEEMAARIHQQQIEFLSNEHLSKGVSLYSKKRYDEACVELEMALNLNPKNIKALTSLGSLYRTQKKYKKAVEMFEAALALDKRNENNKQFLVKALQAYIENNEDDDLTKLNFALRVVQLTKQRKKTILFEKYLGSLFTLIDGFQWLKDYHKENYVVSDRVEERDASDMEIDSEEETEPVILEENVPAERIIFSIHKPPAPSRPVVPNPLVSYDDDDDVDEEEAPNNAAKPTSNTRARMPSLEEVSSDSLELGPGDGVSNNHVQKSDKAKRDDARKDNDHHDRLKYIRRRPMSRSPEHLHPEDSSHRHRRRSLSMSQTPKKRRSSSSGKVCGHDTGKRTRDIPRRSSSDRYSSSSEHSAHIPRRYRLGPAIPRSKLTKCRKKSHRHDVRHKAIPKAYKLAHKSHSRHCEPRRVSHSKHGSRVYQKHSKSRDELRKSKAEEKKHTCKHGKVSRRHLEQEPHSHVEAPSPERSSTLEEEIVVVSHSPASVGGHEATPVEYSHSGRVTFCRSVSGTAKAGACEEELDALLSVEVRMDENYVDLDVPEKVEKEEQLPPAEYPWKPSSDIPVTAYPSFLKESAISIMNEIVDMIEEEKTKRSSS